MNFLKIKSSDHIQGSINASIELIEYGDYQCSYCRQAHHVVKDLLQKLGENLKFVFRNYPLEEIHLHALHASIAAETAALHGKFWEMHDMLYENQHDLDDSAIVSYALRIGLDPKMFEKEFGSQSTIDKIKYDIESGNRSGVQGTPSFFVNGEHFDGDWTNPQFFRYLKSLI
jgi:Protein-disulfide isomerase